MAADPKRWAAKGRPPTFGEAQRAEGARRAVRLEAEAEAAQVAYQAEKEAARLAPPDEWKPSRPRVFREREPTPIASNFLDVARGALRAAAEQHMRSGNARPDEMAAVILDANGYVQNVLIVRVYELMAPDAIDLVSASRPTNAMMYGAIFPPNRRQPIAVGWLTDDAPAPEGT